MIDLKNKFSAMSLLSPLLFLYTVVYFGMMIADFAAREMFDMPSGMMVVYVTLVGAYAADKEIGRWMGKEAPPKMGSVFVYLWLLFFLTAFVIRSFNPSFKLPDDLTAVALQVLGVFFGSKASKKIYDLKIGKTEEARSREETILQMVKEKGKVEKKEIMAALKLSDSSAGRILDAMEKKKQLQQVGGYKDTYYVQMTKLK